MSVSEYIRTVIGSCVQIMYALKVLSVYAWMMSHCKPSTGRSYRQTAVLIQRLVGVHQYVRPTARRGVHPSQCALQLRPGTPADRGTIEELCRAANERLFNSIVGNKHHVLYHLLPPKAEASQC